MAYDLWRLRVLWANQERAMTSITEATEVVSDVLYESDQDLYVYAPPGQHRIVGEALVLGAAGLLLRGFFRGLKAAAEKRAEEWGETFGEWLFDRMKALFQPDSEPRTEPDTEDLLAEAKQALNEHGSTGDAESREIELMVEDTLLRHKLPPDRAAAIAHVVKEQASVLLRA